MIEPKPMDPARLAAATLVAETGRHTGDQPPLLELLSEAFADRKHREAAADRFRSLARQLTSERDGLIRELDDARREGLEARDEVRRLHDAIAAHDPGARPDDFVRRLHELFVEHEARAKSCEEARLNWQASTREKASEAAFWRDKCSTLRLAIETAIKESEDGSASDAVQEMLLTLEFALSEMPSEANDG